MRWMSGSGGGGPGLISRNTPMPKQKALKRTMIVPVPIISTSGITSPNVALAPTPLARATSPVRTHAAYVRSAA
jgi:hypothetical protein